jgi:peptide/nickel transport system substrate-binding protein
MLTPTTPFFWTGSDQVAPTFDLQKASGLLDQAGWTAGTDGMRQKNGVPLTLPLWVINDSTTVLQAQIIEQQLAKVGIKVDTKQYEQTAWFAAARSGEQVGFIIGIFNENADGILYFYFYSKQQPAPNRFAYGSPEVDGWLEDSRTNPDRAAVQKDYEQVQQRIIADAPTAPLIHELGTLGVGDSVQGIKVHPSRWLYRMTDVSLTKK